MTRLGSFNAFSLRCFRLYDAGYRVVEVKWRVGSHRAGRKRVGSEKSIWHVASNFDIQEMFRLLADSPGSYESSV